MDKSRQNCLIIAGEKSGEDHCLSFFDELRHRLPNTHFWGVGGDSLEKKGMELVFHLKDFSSFGFSEVFFKIPFYIKAYLKILKEVEKRNCKVAILIDFQTFNLKLAKRFKKKGITVLYYVAPQAWAWKAWRAEILEKTVHTLFTIIPFEKNWFMKRGVRRVQGVPHPLWITYKEQIENKKLDISAKPFSKVEKCIQLLLLPGSRNFEVKLQLPIFWEAVEKLRNYVDVKTSIVCCSNIKKENYLPYIDKIDRIYDNTELPDALTEADFALATSGTITLATALFEVPTLVCYKGSMLNEVIFNVFVRYKGFISLANIVHDKMVFPEFIQQNVNIENLNRALLNWINNKDEYEKIKKSLSETKNMLKGETFKLPDYMSRVISESYYVNETNS